MAIKILIVEDEPDIRKTLQYNLAKESYDVATAGSISEAKSLTNQNQPHLICLLYTSPSPRDATLSRMPSSA